MPTIDQGLQTLLVAILGGAISQGGAIVLNRLNAKDQKDHVQSEQSRVLLERQGTSISQLWERLDTKDAKIEEQDNQIIALQRQLNDLAPKAARVPELETRLQQTEANFREFLALIDAARREISYDGAVFCIPAESEAVEIYRDLVRRGILTATPRTAPGRIIRIDEKGRPKGQASTGDTSPLDAGEALE